MRIGMRRSAYDDGKAVFPLPRILMTIATRRSEPVTFALPQNMGQMLKRTDDNITNVERTRAADFSVGPLIPQRRPSRISHLWIRKDKADRRKARSLT
jgi:hypothetical protein